MKTTAVIIIPIPNNFLSFPKPNGINPIIPPTATLLSLFSAESKEAIIIKNIPKNTIPIPTGNKYFGNYPSLDPYSSSGSSGPKPGETLNINSILCPVSNPLGLFSTPGWPGTGLSVPIGVPFGNIGSDVTREINYHYGNEMK